MMRARKTSRSNCCALIWYDFVPTVASVLSTVDGTEYLRKNCIWYICGDWIMRKEGGPRRRCAGCSTKYLTTTWHALPQYMGRSLDVAAWKMR